MSEDGVYGAGSAVQNRMGEGKKVVENDRLTALVKAGDLGVTKAEYLLERFRNFFDVAAEWEKKAREIVVTDAGQTEIMALARTGRLFLKDRRVELEKERKRLKEQALREGQTIDGIANVLKGLICPLEEYLDKQEHFVEYRAREEAEKKRIEEERVAEVERKRKEKEEQEERDKVRAENERLRREAAAKERELEVERAAARRKQEEADRKVREAEKKVKVAEEAAREAVRVAEQTVAAVEVFEDAVGDSAITNLLQSEVKCPHCGGTFLLEDAG